MALDNGTMAVTEEVVSVVPGCGARIRDGLGLQRGIAPGASFSRPSFCRGFALGVFNFRKDEFLQCRVRGRGGFSKPRKPKRQARKPAEGEATTTGKEAPRQKRPTLATVSASLESLMSAIPQLTSQIQHVAGRQEKFEVKMMDPRANWRASGSGLRSYHSRSKFGSHCKGFGSATQDYSSAAPWTFGAPDECGEAEDRAGVGRRKGRKRVARSVQPGKSSSCPEPCPHYTGFADCSSWSGPYDGSINPGSGDKHEGSSSMHPRHLLHLGLASYVEEDGANQQLRDDAGSDDGPWNLRRKIPREVWRLRPSPGMGNDGSGLLMEGNIPAAKDTITLLAVTIEQGVLDHGKLEIASLLCLQEDVPAGVFMTRQARASSTVRLPLWQTRIKWITCALAYMKEMDVITSKRLEYVQAPKPSIPGPDEPGPNKQPKGAPKKKGGKGQTKGEEEELCMLCP